MTKAADSGHAKNVANFEKLVSKVTAFGTPYNPSKAGLKLPALNTQLTAAKTVLGTLNSAEATCKSNITVRQIAFKPFLKLITRVKGALKSSDISTQVFESALFLINKLQGRRAKPKKSDAEKKAAAEAGKEIVEISSAQTDIDSRLDYFDKLIKLLATITAYAPNEADLKVAALTALYTDLKTKNSAVVNVETQLENARITRNDLLYKDGTGIIDISLDVKNYIMSVFGASSPQYKEVRGLKFIRR